MKTLLTKIGDLMWRSDTRHSEALVSWVMLSVSFTTLLKYADQQLMGFLVYAVVMLFVAIIGFGASVSGSYLARIQCAMLRTFCWPAVAIHALATGHAPVYSAPFYAGLTLAEALIYIKLYLLLSQRRENGKDVQ